MKRFALAISLLCTTAASTALFNPMSAHADEVHNPSVQYSRTSSPDRHNLGLSEESRNHQRESVFLADNSHQERIRQQERERQDRIRQQERERQERIRQQERERQERIRQQELARQQERARRQHALQQQHNNNH